MNANELADLLEVDSWYKLVTREEIAAMLRQQQVLIENLNGRIERMIEKQSHYESMAHAGGFEAGRELGMKQERERNNEPVAWRCNKFYENQEGWFYNENEIGEPLYTHPVKELDEQFKKGFEAGKEEGWKAHKFHHPVKELTDEEIVSLYKETEADNGGIREFARAILRKAQEK